MKKNCTAFRRAFAWSAGACLVASAQAGGHFDVDDAGTLDPGQCQQESWISRTGKRPAALGLHVGPSCRLGPVELGVSVDRTSVPGERATSAVGPQLKWTFHGQAADAPLAAALSGGVLFDVTRGGRAGGQLLVPVTWRPLDTLQIHANLGADWATGTGARTGRGGLQAEWAVNDTLSLIAERNRAFRVWTSRVGLRYSLTPLLSVDMSAARIGAGDRRENAFVLGFNYEWSRR